MFGILSFLIWPVIIIGGIIYFVRRRKNKNTSSIVNQKDWYLNFALCKEDAVSQFFFLLGVLFFGITFFAFNRDFGSPISWQTIFLITSVLGLVCAYYFKLVYTLVFSLLGVVIWWIAKTATWIEFSNIKPSSILTGLVFFALIFYILGRIHEKHPRFKRFALVYLILSIIFITVLMFIFSTKPGLSGFVELTKGADFFASWQMSVSLLLLFMAIISAGGFALGYNLIAPFEVLVLVIFVFLFSIMAFLPEQALFLSSYSYYSTSGGFTATGIVWAVLFNAFAFLEMLGLIFLGYARKESWLINMGALFLFLLIIVKYFDWFFSFLDKSVFFIGAGLLLLVVGWSMEKGRRYMITSINSDGKAL